MKHHRIVVFALTLLLLSGPGAALRGQADLSGSWELMLPPPPPRGARQERRPEDDRRERQRGPPRLILVLEQDGESLTGLLRDPQGQVGTVTGSVQGDVVTLLLTLQSPDERERELHLEGTLDGDTMAGTLPGRREDPDRAERRGAGPEWMARRQVG